ncbi:MAG: DUF2752 domain-containing protein [Bacteroidota bacterium]
MITSIAPFFSMSNNKPYYIELICWCTALLFLFLFNPMIASSFSFCLLHNAGLSFCPGCGLGRSISFLLHGDISSSFRTHLLGIPAVIVLMYRIMQLILHVKRYHQLQRSLL